MFLVENTGNSYNLKPLADNLDLTHLSNAAWRDKFKAALQSAINNGVDLALPCDRRVWLLLMPAGRARNAGV